MRWILPFAPRVPQCSPMVFWEGNCPYLEGRKTLTAGSSVRLLGQDDYQELMDIGMRRTGHVVYRPICVDCRQCHPLRINTTNFKLSKSQKKIWNKYKHFFNVTVTRPIADKEHVDLYNRYQKDWHQSEETVLDLPGYQEAFVFAPVETLELSWRNQQGQLVGVGILDVLPKGYSSVYFYWDPDFADYHLGTLSVLQEIELTRNSDNPMYYIGFYIKESPKMAYKIQFAGAEIWDGAQWKPLQTRNNDDARLPDILRNAEKGAMVADRDNFPFHRAVKVFSQSG